MIVTALLPLLMTAAASAEAPQPTLPVQEAEAPKPAWTGSVAAGAILRSGNNETRTANATADAVWKVDKNRVTLGALWSYQDDTTGVTQRKTYGDAKYDHFLSEKAFAYGQASGNSDKDAQLNLRLTLGAGAGEQFIDNETWQFSAEAGLSGISEDFKNSGKNEYIAARAAYSAKYMHNSSWEFAQDAEIYPSLESGDDIYTRVDTRAKLTLTESMFAQFQWVLEYDNTPDTGKERVDNLLAVSVGWSF
jgi:putative salt-induced outer membrane protein YdiY